MQGLDEGEVIMGGCNRALGCMRFRVLGGSGLGTSGLGGSSLGVSGSGGWSLMV